ncbi:MAG TPA: hypothetical protein H9683_05280 [Firmicutes bacterium]|nr:hypothetical protein [Bacillota bacterium]
MSKKFLFGLIVSLMIVVIAVLWLLSALDVAGMEWFSLGWAATIAAAILGVAFIGRGLFGKTAGPLKKLWIFFGAVFLVVAVITLACEIAMPGEIVMPIIAVVLAVALLIGFIAVGGKKWDTGDNQKAGYKNYYERKAEEEARKQDEEDKKD